MATGGDFARPKNTKKVRLPPKRGQIKARIIQHFVKFVCKVVSSTVKGKPAQKKGEGKQKAQWK